MEIIKSLSSIRKKRRTLPLRRTSLPWAPENLATVTIYAATIDVISPIALKTPQ
jgi:hypothetical protein